MQLLPLPRPQAQVSTFSHFESLIYRHLSLSPATVAVIDGHGRFPLRARSEKDLHDVHHQTGIDDDTRSPLPKPTVLKFPPPRRRVGDDVVPAVMASLEEVPL